MAQESGQQVLSATLPQILEITKVYVETVEYDRDAPLQDVIIKTVSPVNQNLNVVGLSPMRIKIHTNASAPITVKADFQQLNNADGTYNFSASDLRFSPSSYTINKPTDNMITGEFIPTINVRNTAIAGMYEGRVMFTLGAV